MKKFFLSHKIFCIIIASILVLGAITGILLVTKDNIDTEQGNSNKAVSSTISIPDISDDTSSKELLSDSNNYISPNEELASSSSASSTATASSQRQTEVIQSSTPTQPTTSSQAPAAAKPPQTTTPTQTPEQQPGLSESTNKPLTEWQFEFDEEELKGACCDCCGLPKGDGTNGTCEGSSETPFFENGQLKIRFVCKNNEKVVIFEE